MLKNIVISEKSILTFQAKNNINELRCTKLRELKFRFHAKRTTGSWMVRHKNAWLKMGEWPTIKAKDARAALPETILRLQNNLEANFGAEHFSSVGDLLSWYKQRMNDNSNIGTQRKKDINSALKCHLIPKLGDLKIVDVTLPNLDSLFIWPTQKNASNSSLLKYFSILKAAFKDAHDLQLIKVDPVINYKLSDFGEFRINPKEGKIKPKQVPQVLEQICQQPVKIYVMTMVMLTLGNRLGETRQARWSNIHLNNDPEWNIPAKHTKTNKGHDIKLPEPIANILRAWKKHQRQRHYTGDFVFPNHSENDCINNNESAKQIKSASKGQWSAHDLRKCARTCWAEQGIDYMVCEKMLNHTLGKVAETYLNSKVTALRLEALNAHCNWLEQQFNGCFEFNKVLHKKMKSH